MRGQRPFPATQFPPWGTPGCPRAHRRLLQVLHKLIVRPMMQLQYYEVRGC
jgi:hypothetical protein